MKNIRNNDIVTGLVVLLIGIYIFIESIRLLEVGEYYDSPGLLPVIISSIIILSSIVMLWNGINKEKIKINANLTGSANNIEKKPLFTHRIFVIIFIIALYIIILDYFGFLFSSILFLFVLMYYLKSTTILKIIIFSVIVPVLIQYVFKNIFNQIIP
jgi:hypothetical protein